jgi:hypothetical protein
VYRTCKTAPHRQSDDEVDEDEDEEEATPRRRVNWRKSRPSSRPPVFDIPDSPVGRGTQLSNSNNQLGRLSVSADTGETKSDEDREQKKEVEAEAEDDDDDDDDVSVCVCVCIVFCGSCDAIQVLVQMDETFMCRGGPQTKMSTHGMMENTLCYLTLKKGCLRRVVIEKHKKNFC